MFINELLFNINRKQIIPFNIPPLSIIILDENILAELFIKLFKVLIDTFVNIAYKIPPLLANYIILKNIPP